METAAFQRGAAIAETRAESMRSKFTGMGKSLLGMGAALGAGVVIDGITTAVQGAFELGSSLSEASEKLGLTVEGLQRLRVAARETGVSNEQLDGVMMRLNRSMGELQLGSDAATKAYAQIGLSADDLKGKKPDEALRLIADALNKIPDPQQRIAIGSDLMGRGFAQIIPMISGGSAALEKYAEQSRKSGEVSDENAKKLDELADRWEGMKVTVGVATANMIGTVASWYESVNAALLNLKDQTERFDRGVMNMARNAVTWVNEMVSGIADAITGRLSAIWESARAKIEVVKNSFFKLYDAVVGHSYIPDMVEGIANEMARLQEIMVDPALTATQKVGAAFQSLSGIVGSLFGRKAGGILSSLGQVAGVVAGFTGPKFDAAGFGGIESTNSSFLSKLAGASSSGMISDGVTRIIVDTSPLLTGMIVQGDRSAAVMGASQAQSSMYKAAARSFP